MEVDIIFNKETDMKELSSLERQMDMVAFSLQQVNFFEISVE